MTDSEDGGITTVQPGPSPGRFAPTQNQLLDLYRDMVLCRTLDERIWMLNRQGKAAIVASAQGHEAAQLGSASALRRGIDRFFIYYRDLAVQLYLGLTPSEIMLGYMGKEGEPLSGGRQFPSQGYDPKSNLFNLSNVVGTQIPQAAGSALVSKIKGDGAVTIVYFGDGATSTGDCHESMNFAGIHRLPMIFFYENNKYAISVPISLQMAVSDLSSRVKGYGLAYEQVEGTDPAAVYSVTSEAAERARAGQGATVIEARVERYLPHTSDDDDTRYRSEEELSLARLHDPLTLLRDSLSAAGILAAAQDEEIRSDAMRQVNDATDFVESAPYPSTDTFGSHVYAPDRGAS